MASILRLRPASAIPGFLFSRQFTSTSRTLVGPWSAPVPSSAKLHPYLVVAQDNPSALPTRLSVREQHLAEAKEGKQNGRISLGGALLSKDHPEAGEGKEKAQSIIGSVLIIMAEDEEAARRAVQKDVYSTSGVFESVQIWPFMPAALAEEAQPSGPEVIKKAAHGTASSLGHLREMEINKWKEAAMNSLEFLRKGGAGTHQIS